MKTLKELKNFIILWLTQSFSALGSSMTSFALVIWLYSDSGSALTTSLLTVCSYAPYVLMSIFAGAVSDKWNKKAIMLICDSFAAVCTVITLILLKTGSLAVWHLYILNALNGLMNSIQSPASDVAVTLLTPEKHYQKTSGMRSFSNSLVSILTPVLAAAVMSFAGIEAVIAFDLTTFAAAFLVLLLFIRIPQVARDSDGKETLLQSAKSGLSYLKGNQGILWLILFLSAINLIASMYSAALPALIISKAGETAYGIVNSFVGVATLLGSVAATVFPKPKSRSNVPKQMQGRVYSVRNTLQFFTIPVGYFLGGFLVDNVFEPLMENTQSGLLKGIFGSGKGSGAAMLFFFIAVSGVIVCLIFRRIKALRELE